MTDDITLYAEWKKESSYTIRFDGNGADGGATAAVTVGIGRSIQLPVCGYTRTGYSFTGWNLRPDGKGTSYADGSTVTNLSRSDGGTVTLYAMWKANSYQVAFDANGGTGTMKAQTMTYDKDAALTAGSFKRVGHTFVGWSTDPNAVTPQFANRQKLRNLTAESGGIVTLYAVWNKHSYQLIFNANGGRGDMADDGGFCEYDTTYILPQCSFTRPGFDFAGWATKANGKAVYQDGQEICGLSSTNGAVINLYAVWTPHHYDIVFKAEGDGITGSMKPMLNRSCGTTYTLTANTFKRANYTFAGWNTEPDGSGDFWPNKAKQANFVIEDGAVLTLYAQWKPTEYKITYKNVTALDGNENSNVYTVEDSVSLLAPSRPGSVFEGWYLDAKFTKPVTPDFFNGGAKTVYANWSVVEMLSYSVAFDANGGTGSMKSMAGLVCGKTYTLTRNAFKRTGYTFAGWSTESSGEIQYSNGAKIANLSTFNGDEVVLYAVWTPTPYKISYKNTNALENAENPELYTVAEPVELRQITRPGCEFAGWYLDAKFTRPVTGDSFGNGGAVTLYAKWIGTANIYSIAFDGNGASFGKMSTLTKRSAGTIYTLTANAFKRVGYTFAGWSTEPDGAVFYRNKEKVANLCPGNGGTVTLYAVWEPITYTITYKNVNEARIPTETSYTIEDSFALSIPKKDGWTFAGWYTTATFKAGTEVESIDAGRTGNLTLYAKWVMHST